MVGQSSNRRRPVPVHNLRPNETVWTPPHVVFLDTETRWHDEGPDEVHELRLWVGCRIDRRHIRKTQPPVVWAHGDDRDSLARQLSEWTRGRECLWVYAHNLGFDLVTSDLPATMARRGWQVTDFSVRNTAPWIRFSRANHTITCCDSWGWLPESLGRVGQLVDRAKTDLPTNDGTQGEWWGRCAGDVEILARAILGLMEWWGEEKLGRWTISGPGCGWNAMRHVPSLERHVIDPDPPKVAQDRSAIRGGRKDAQVVRSESGGPWVELDLVAAYPTVALHLPLPSKRAWGFDQLPLESPWIGNRFYAPLAECTVRTDRPRYPVRHAGVTWYPVGEFRTWLAGPEIASAQARGDLRSIGCGQIHKLGYALRPWAQWVLDPTSRGDRLVPPVAQIVTKAWGRSVLGKFAARSHDAESLPGLTRPGWSTTDAWDHRVGRRGSEVDIGNRHFWVTYDGDTENCYPAVLAWVESEVRVRLGAVLDALGAAWWACDTDGLILDLRAVDGDLWRSLAILGKRPLDILGVAQGLCDVLAPLVAPLVIRPKRVIESLAVLGPQHLQVDGERRYAGVRKDATETTPGTFVSRDWPGLAWQINNSRPGQYRRPERTSTFRAPTAHRWILDDGTAAPVEMRVGRDGRNQLVPWAETELARSGARLGGAQYPALARLS